MGYSYGYGYGYGTRPVAAASGGGEELGPELWPQPDFDGTAGLTLNGWTVAGGQADSNGQLGFLTATSPEAFVDGATYRVAIAFASNPNEGTLLIQMGGATLASPSTTATQDIVYGFAPTSQLIRLRDVDEAGIVIESLSIRRVL